MLFYFCGNSLPQYLSNKNIVQDKSGKMSKLLIGLLVKKKYSENGV
jgi:hypothetical protein